jgi:putative tryptophan/tyrosine transport system substrate-binding protein
MKRREFGIVLGAAISWPLFAFAQRPSRAPRIGVLFPGPPAIYATQLMELRQGLHERGYAEPQTLELIVRYSGNELERLPTLAQELVSNGPDIIVTSSTPGVRAVMTATSTIPIVIGAAADPVGSGLVASLAKPGGNVTGQTLLIPDLAAKQAELIKEFVPELTRIGVLRGRGEGAQAVQMISTAVTALGIKPDFEEVESLDEIGPALDRMVDSQYEALLLVDGPTLNSRGEALAALALSHHLPTISTLRLFVERGSLVAYGPNLGGMYRRVSYFIDRILKGAHPGSLPIEQPNSFELVINQQTAKSLGLVIPTSILARADELLE